MKKLKTELQVFQENDPLEIVREYTGAVPKIRSRRAKFSRYRAKKGEIPVGFEEFNLSKGKKVIAEPRTPPQSPPRSPRRRPYEDFDISPPRTPRSTPPPRPKTPPPLPPPFLHIKEEKKPPPTVIFEPIVRPPTPTPFLEEIKTTTPLISVLPTDPTSPFKNIFTPIINAFSPKKISPNIISNPKPFFPQFQLSPSPIKEQLKTTETTPLIKKTVSKIIKEEKDLQKQIDKTEERERLKRLKEDYLPLYTQTRGPKITIGTSSSEGLRFRPSGDDDVPVAFVLKSDILMPKNLMPITLTTSALKYPGAPASTIVHPITVRKTFELSKALGRPFAIQINDDVTAMYMKYYTK